MAQSFCADRDCLPPFTSRVSASLWYGRTVHGNAVFAVAWQVHPVVSRLCAAIEGTDPARLADCLGLDPSRFRGAAGGGAAADAREDALVSGSAYFDDEDRFKVHCTVDFALLLQSRCRTDAAFSAAVVGLLQMARPGLERQ